MDEIWKDIEGYENDYQVSNLGRVKSLPKKCWNGKGYWFRDGRILIPIKSKKGYLNVWLLMVKTYYTHIGFLVESKRLAKTTIIHELFYN